MGAQQGKERGSHSSGGGHGGTASCIGVPSSGSPVGLSSSHGISVGSVNALAAGSTLRGSRIKSSATPAAVGGSSHRSAAASGSSIVHTSKDNHSRCNVIGMNIFTEHNGEFDCHCCGLLVILRIYSYSRKVIVHIKK